jgi:hypothetical protein
LLVSGQPATSTTTQDGAISSLTKPFSVVAFRRAVLPLLRTSTAAGNVVNIQTGSGTRG